MLILYSHQEKAYFIFLTTVLCLTVDKMINTYSLKNHFTQNHGLFIQDLENSQKMR